MRVALIQGPVWGIYDPPVALAQLSSCLKNEGHEVSAFDANIDLYNVRKEEYKTVWAIEQSSFWCNSTNVSKFFRDNNRAVEDYIDKVIYFEPEIVGFSVNTASVYATLEFAERIKRRNKHIKIVAGGPMFLVPVDDGLIKHMLLDSFIDVVIFDEGEETFCCLLSLLERKKELDLCKGLYFKKNGMIVKTEQRPLIKDLDRLLFLDFTDFPLDRYDPPGHLGKHISLMTSRGCIQNCVFCGPKGYWPGFRTMSGKRIYEEIKFHRRRNPEIEHIEFLDLLFNGNMRTLNEFCDLMASNPAKNEIKWHANAVIRPEMTPKILRKMKEAGCYHLTYGIESGSQYVLNLMRKRYKVEDADKVLRCTHESGIRVTCNFMFGFPGETEEDFQQTLGFLKRNRKYIDVAYPSRTFCTIEPYSYMEKHLSEFEIIPNPAHGQYWESKDKRNTFPVRMSRCEKFSDLARTLGVDIGLGLQTSIEHDHWLNLGYYYESKKDYKDAIDCFSNYLKLDPKNEAVLDKVSELKNHRLETNTTNSQISFNWDIHYRCNYRCPYCWFYGKWADAERQNIYPAREQLTNSWKKIYSKHGSAKIAITGGEPFLYPNFAELIKELSQMHKIEIITNLSVDVEDFSNKIKKENVRVNPSFHPLFANFDKFMKRVLFLKDRQIIENISYLAWPPQIPRIPYFQEKFNKFGIHLSIQSFFGEYRRARYPDSYTDEERKIIMPNIGTRGGEAFQIGSLVTKGRLCAAGKRYGVIHPNGEVLRCGGIRSTDSIVGNLLDDDFKLLDKPLPCTAEICPCNEWAFLLEKVKEA